MEVDGRRTPDGELGAQVAAGRDATIHDAGPGRVLRRTPDERDLLREAVVMEHLRQRNYPVPEVFRVGPGELVLARIEGPTMLEDLESHPWRIDAHARTLAELHTRLHAIDGTDPALADVPHHPLPGTSVLHQDLHPGNVICSPAGPVVIDWTNARVGDAAADVALTWILMAAFELDHEPPTGSLPHRLATRVERALVPRIRRRLVRTFLRASGVEDQARRALSGAAAHRLADRSVRPGEVAAIEALVARVAGEAGAAGHR